MRFATKSGIQLVPHSVPNWRELVRNLVPRLVPNLVIDLVPDLVSDEMPNLILVVPDLVSQIWYYYQICPTDLVLDRVPDLVAALLEPDLQSDRVHQLASEREQIWYQI